MLLAALTAAWTMGATCADDGGCPISERRRGHENIEWSTGYSYHLTDANRHLPRVLLVGDSICSGYQTGVRKLLEGDVNVSYWISSYCVTCTNYMKFLDIYLSETKYDVVHFNNGLHSLGMPPDVWARKLEAALRLIRERQPSAKIIWTTSTPLKEAKLTARAQALNAAAAAVVGRLGGIATDDLFALLDPLDRNENWSDSCHHRPALREKEAAQVAQSIRTALGL